MKRKIDVAYNTDFRNRWNGITLDSIAKEIWPDPNEVSLEQRYFKNLAGEFFGSLLLITDDKEYYFNQSQAITHSTKSVADLGKCLGKYFKIEVKTHTGIGLNQFNEGFMICEPNESPAKVNPVQLSKFPISELPKEKQALLTNKSIHTAFHDGLISSIEKKNNNFIFIEQFSNRVFIIIDGYKIYLSKSVVALTDMQFTSMLDEFVFYSGTSDLKNSSFGQDFFRLGVSTRLVAVEFTSIEFK